MAKTPEGKATAVQFKDHEALEAWLMTQPREVAVAIAARVALRGLPLVAAEIPTHGNQVGAYRFARLISAVFRCAAVARVTSAFSTRSLHDKAVKARSAARVAASHYTTGYADAAVSGASAAASREAADAATYAAASADSAAKCADRVAWAVSGRRQPVTGRGDMWSAVSRDASRHQGVELASLPLWPDGAPDWAADHWRHLREALPLVDDWQVWIDWYQRRLDGVSDPEDIELVYATVPPSEWDKGPAVANKWIRERLEELRQKSQKKVDSPSSETPAITVPPPKPATLEPIIRAGKIALLDGAAEPELDAEAFNDALKALRSLIVNLGNDLEGEANIDKRAIGLLRRIGDSIPEKAPTQAQLFELAHLQETLEDYGKKVEEQWPDLLASRYLGVVRAFDGTMRQFVKWRTFKQNALKDRLTDEQRANAPKLARKFADALREAENAAHVESAIPTVIDSMARDIEAQGADALPRERGAAGADTRPEDLITSIDNTIKRIGDVAAKAHVEKKKAKASFGAKVAKGFASQFEGEKLGENFGKWATTGLLGACAGYVAVNPTELGNILAELMQQYPIIAQWLQPMVEHLRR